MPISMNRFIQAAEGAVPSNSTLKPMNCHEAVLGWALQGLDSAYCNPAPSGFGELAWKVVRDIASANCADSKQLTQTWVAQNLYGDSARWGQILPGADVSAGEVLFMGNKHWVSHSMAVINTTGGAVNCRGFNNAGAFGNDTYMKWDTELQNLADKSRWKDGEFRAVNGPTQIGFISLEKYLENVNKFL